MKTLNIKDLNEAPELGSADMAGVNGGFRPWGRVLPWEEPVVLPPQPEDSLPELSFPGTGPTFPV